MTDSIILNLKKVIKGILPIIIFVLILSIILKIDIGTIIRFLSSSLLVIMGLTLFTTGTDISLNEMGKNISNLLIKKKNIILILIVSLLLGTFITLLEPEFLTIGYEAGNIPTSILLISVSISIGIFLMLAMYRILKRINLRYYIIISYLLIFFVLTISNFQVVPFAFDMGSVVVGAISAPFILAFGGNLASKMKRKDSSEFGILSFCAIGPILMILILSLIYKPNIMYDSDPILKKLDFLETLWTNFYQVFMSLSLLVIFYLFLTRKTKKKKIEQRKIMIGLIMVLVGITLFLTGGDVGFFKLAYLLGSKLGNINKIIIILIGGIFGFLIAKIEPNVKVLVSYVDQVTNGGIKDKFLETCLCIGVSISFMLSLFRVLNGYSVMIFLIPTYFLAIFFAFFTPTNFLGLSFDAGGVVTGSMSSSFLLPLLIGVASIITNNYLNEAFGVMALISIIPIIILEIVGMIYNIEVKNDNTKYLDDKIIDYGEV
ncbi:MAG: DUF1538 family protein [Bacilli bacterium]